MTISNPQDSFTETQHALLFASVVKAIVERAGKERGEEIARLAVRRYGEERGRRMAQRARANRDALSMGNFLAYSEYRNTPGVFDSKITERAPHVQICITRCPWHGAWKAHDLMPYGRLYCQEIDEALVRGFNPELRLDVLGTLSNDAARCEFSYRGANMTMPHAVSFYFKRNIYPGKRAAMPWTYHAGHLYATLEKTAVEELGALGKAAVEAGLEEFAGLCGAEAREAVLAGRGVDYEKAI